MARARKRGKVRKSRVKVLHRKKRKTLDSDFSYCLKVYVTIAFVALGGFLMVAMEVIGEQGVGSTFTNTPILTSNVVGIPSTVFTSVDTCNTRRPVDQSAITALTALVTRQSFSLLSPAKPNALSTDSRLCYASESIFIRTLKCKETPDVFKARTNLIRDYCELKTTEDIECLFIMTKEQSTKGNDIFCAPVVVKKGAI